MKKNYLIILLLFPVLAKSQTVTQSDLPTAGLYYINAVDTNYTATIPAGGTSQTWDYTGLLNDTQDTVGFMSSAGTPYLGNFSGANLASLHASDTTWSYFTNNPTGFYVNGIVSSSGSAFVYTPAHLYVPVPFSYNSTRTNVARVIVDTVYTGQNIRLILNTTSTFLGDGTGTIRLPNGDQTGVLRIRETDIVYDSIFLNLGAGIYVPVSNSAAQTTSFLFIKPGLTAALIATVNADSLGQFATDAQYILSNFNSVPVISSTSYQVYPNPADGQITVSLSEMKLNYSIAIYDAVGKLVLSKELPVLVSSIDVSSLPKGIYFYQLTDGKVSSVRGSILIQH